MFNVDTVVPCMRKREFFADIGPFFMSPDVRREMPYLKDEPRKTWFLARDSKTAEVVGIAGVVHRARWNELCSLYVKPEWRRRGVGRLLTDVRLAFCTDTRVRSVCNPLTAPSYLKRGFVEVMRRGSYVHLERKP